MNRKSVIGLVITFLVLLPVLSAATSTVSAYSQIPIFIIDAPHRVEPGKEIPVMVFVHNTWRPFKLQSIDIIDDKTGNDVASRSYDRDIAFNELWHDVFEVERDLFTSGNTVSIKARFRIEWAVDQVVGPVDVSVGSQNLPKWDQWYAGDAHVHSSMTNNVAEFGAPVDAIASSAKAMGLDWIILTDHSHDINPFPDEWNTYKTYCDAKTTNEFACMLGEEITCQDAGHGGGIFEPASHYLAYGISDPVKAPNWGWPFSDNPTQQGAINDVKYDKGGIGFIAHPFAFPWDWENWAVSGYTGIEIWNGEWGSEDQQALSKWESLIKQGKRVFGIGNSDAHDLASIARHVRTYVYLGDSDLTRDNVIGALGEGHFVVTDGPLLTFTADSHIVGETFDSNENIVDLSIGWKSTAEYGKVKKIDITMGGLFMSIPEDSFEGTIIMPVPLVSTGLSHCIVSCETDTGRKAYTNPIWVNRVHNLDLIFAIDVTGSMWDDIAAVKASASEIVEAIDSKVTGYRIAVVSYRDFPVWPYGDYGDWTYKDVLSFSSDKTAIIAAIQSLYVGGGADWQESVYSALMHCIDSSSLGGWRTGADKFIILMGDAPPHDPEPFTGYTLSTVTTAAEEADPVSIYPIAIGPDSTTYTYFSWLAEGTDGKVFTAETASEVPEAIIEAIEEIIDTTPPEIDVTTPAPTDPPQALQDGVTLEATVSDPSGVDWVTFSVREPNGEQGAIIDPMFESMPATHVSDDTWVMSDFNTNQPLLPDGYYLLIARASDTLGNEGSVTVRFSIRNWASLELLPATQNNKAGRTMPVKFSLRVIESVDPAEPFVHNEELTIKIRRKDTGAVCQTSIYGDTARDYRIDSVGELYITNFQTLKTPLTYVVEIYRKDFFIGSFEFKTVK